MTFLFVTSLLKFNIVLKVFEQYQKARTAFVQTVAELATRPQNIETLQNAGIMALLRPLLLDVVPTIQQTAALALGRLANYNDNLAEAVVKGDILPQLVYSLSEQNVIKILSFFFISIVTFYFILKALLQKSSCFCIKSRSKTFTTISTVCRRLWCIRFTCYLLGRI
jgi:hypothetical protein